MSKFWTPKANIPLSKQKVPYCRSKRQCRTFSKQKEMINNFEKFEKLFNLTFKII